MEIPTVAPAPAPLFEINLTPGGLVYPLPEFKIWTCWTDLAPGLALWLQTLIPPIIIAVAIPVTPFVGADDIATLGGERYPPPLLVNLINLIAPFKIPAVPVAVEDAPTKVSLWVDPIIVDIPSSFNPSDSPPVKISSISSIPVSMTSSPYLKSSHLNS